MQRAYNQHAWSVRGKKRWTAGGGVHRSGPHEPLWGGGGLREPCSTTLTVASNHASLELLLLLHETHLEVMGKKQGGRQAVRTLSGVPSDSVACDNLV